MPRIPEGHFFYDFPATWTAEKFDKDTYYRVHFQSFAGGRTAVDVLAFGGGNELWLIEQKDYRVGAQIKAAEMFDAIASKMLDTMACLVAARSNAAAGTRSEIVASGALRKTKVRCVLHIEQPSTHSKLFPQVVDPKTVQDKLRTVLKAIDRRAHAGSQTQLNSLMLGWAIS
ncbi:MAG TPA: hypothetical protein VIH30_11350 [Aquirhabdus sp.]